MAVDGVYGVAQTAVFGAEIVTPFRNAMSFIDSEERDGQLFQKFDSILFRKGFGSHIEQLGAALQQVVFHFFGLKFGEGGVEEVGHTFLTGSVADGIYLVFHKRNKGRNDNCGAFAYHGRQLVAKRLASAGGHDNKGVVAV